MNNLWPTAADLEELHNTKKKLLLRIEILIDIFSIKYYVL